MGDWHWEYDPDETHVIGGPTPAHPAFVAEVEKRADEIARAAEALHLDGTRYHLTIVRQECVYVLQVTP